jgi:hypothetical protein
LARRMLCFTGVVGMDDGVAIWGNEGFLTLGDGVPFPLRVKGKKYRGNEGWLILGQRENFRAMGAYQSWARGLPFRPTRARCTVQLPARPKFSANGLLPPTSYARECSVRAPGEDVRSPWTARGWPRAWGRPERGRTARGQRRRNEGNAPSVRAPDSIGGLVWRSLWWGVGKHQKTSNCKSPGLCG